MAIGLSSIYLSYVAHTSYMWTNSKNRKRTRIVVGTCDTNRTRKATEIFPTGCFCSQARERIPLGEQTRKDLRWPKANRVVGSELWDFIFHTFAGTDRENLQGVSHKQERRVFCGRSISHTFMCYGRFNEPRLSGVTCTCTQYAWPLRNHNSYSIPLAAG